MTEENAVQRVAANAELTPAQRSLQIQMLLNDQVASLSQGQKQLENRLTKVEKEEPIRRYQDLLLEKQRKKRVVGLLGGKESAAYADRELTSKAFRAIMNEYRNKFGVAAYQDTAKQDYNRALKFYANWEPDYELHKAIQEANRKDD